MMKSIFQGELVQGAVKVFVINWGVFAVDLIIGVLIVKYYNSTGKGEFSGIVAFVGLLASIFSLGLNNSRVYFQNKSILTKQDCFTIQIVYLFFLSLILFPSFYILSNSILEHLKIDFHSEVLISLIFTVFVCSQIMALFVISGYLGESKTRQYRKIRFALVSIKLLVVIICVFIGFGVLGIISIIAFTEFLLVGCVFFMENPKFKVLNITRINGIKNYLIYGLKVNTTTIVNTTIRRFDYLVVFSSMGVSMLGKYSVALIFYQLMLSIPQSINGLLFGRLTNSREEINIKSVALIMFLVCLSLSIFLALLLDPIISFLYGNDFLSVIPVAFLLLLAGTIKGTSSVFTMYLMSVNKSILNTYEQLITGVGQLFVMYILVDKYHLLGIGFAVLIGSILSLVLRIYFYMSYGEN